MKIINRYVLREHVGPFLFALSALTSLLLLNYVAKQFGKLVGKGLGWDVIGEFFLLSLPFTVAMTLPMAVLVSTLYAFSRLASEAEITAFKASGVSMLRLLAPVLVAASFIAVGMIAFNDQLLPRANNRLSVLQSDIVRKKPTFALRERVTNKVGDRLWIQSNYVEADNRMREVVIYDLSEPSRPRTVYADSGTLNLSANERDLELMLHQGYMQEFPRENPEQLRRTFFARDLIRVRDVANDLERSEAGQPKTDREMSVCELQSAYARQAAEYRRAHRDAERLVPLVVSEGAAAELPARQTTYIQSGLGALYCRALAALGVSEAARATAALDSLALALASEEQPPAPQADAGGSTPSPAGGAGPGASPGTAYPGAGAPVPSGVAGPHQTPPAPIPPSAGGAEGAFEVASIRARSSRQMMNQFDVEIHKKFALAVACVVFVLLGAPIALRFPRGGVGAVIGVSLVVFALYYVGLIAGETMADKGYLPPYLAMWSANILFTAVALVLLVRMGREGSTTRGGDLGELLDGVKSAFGSAGRRLGLPMGRREVTS